MADPAHIAAHVRLGQNVRLSGRFHVSRRRDDRAILAGFRPAGCPAHGSLRAAARAQEVGPCATQPYRLHRSRKRHHLTAVQAGRWIGKMVHRNGLPDPRPSGCAKVLTPAYFARWGLLAFVAIAAPHGLR
jgi:hypothetical protein